MKAIARTLSLFFFAAGPAFCPAQDAPKPDKDAKAAAMPAKSDQKPADSASDGQIEPEAEKLLASAKDAMKKVRDISYKVKQKGGMGGEEAASGAVSLGLPEKTGMGALPFDRYKVAIQDDKGATKAEWANDGKTIYKIEHAGKKLLSMELKEKGMQIPPQDLWPILPQWVMEDRFDNPMMRTIAVRMGKDAEIGGVKCRVVTRVQEMLLPDEQPEEGMPALPKDRKIVITTVKHLGADDLMPRKVEMTVKGVNMGDDDPNMNMLSEMADLKVNAGLKDSDFALKAPAGFATEPGTYENMGLQNPEQEEPQLKAEAGKPALPFKLKDPAGKEVSLDSLKGRVVLLDFWATWCGPCKKAMPSIQKLHEKFADKAVTIIGVNCWEKDEQLAIKYMEKQKFTYSLLLKGDDLAKAYGISGIPTLILIGKDGNVLHAGVGFGPGEEEHLGEMIQKELDKK